MLEEIKCLDTFSFVRVSRTNVNGKITKLTLKKRIGLVR